MTLIARKGISFLRQALAGLALGLLLVQGAWASSANGLWSMTGGYLAILESSSSSLVVLLQVDATLSSGKVYAGSRSGDTLSTQALDGNGTLAITLQGNSFGGTQTVSGSSQAVSGSLLLAYSGGAYDGIWQRSDGSQRYLALLSLSWQQVPLSVLIDVKLDTSTPSYDVSTGAIMTSSTAQYAGKSLLSGNAVTLGFQGGSPAAATYTARSPTFPPTVVEQFGTTQLLSLSSSASR